MGNIEYQYIMSRSPLSTVGGKTALGILLGINFVTSIAGMVSIGASAIAGAFLWMFYIGIGCLLPFFLLTRLNAKTSPIVDDPFNFGRIASANAISDVYAMGGTPILAIAILGWPINMLPPEVARKVIEGSRSICMEAGIPLAGGHSIDAPEPIFGLAVNGLVRTHEVKQNNSVTPGDILFLTKPLGVGILTTAEKHGILA